MSYDVLLHPDADGFLHGLDDKSERIVRDNLGKLAEDPYPGGGRGDEDKNEVRVTEILPIDEARKRYGY
ncbi:MAG: mRNA-degrading endonuclease RelE of RelBE toxin-antitoxin system [Methanobacteriota archaeon]|jgi:mRNA-degrading endonuclease RelE of RelBE toxin-antitoxin system|uniref:Type II toxin-antitoxin system RelE/ParE family toxin n=1 Tax=Halorutilus salinus TaxID=2487751 RepID=A0A9Q4C5C9_9EURY|nr:type II toxin-antitoxin system RelE/ParE family toxin [Halorutilus salinus]MCX2819753.1 type II toxin-antitoxin system RelE/ParE family toxin [Halorutilus salinus]